MTPRTSTLLSKLHPYRHRQMSQVLAAIVGFVLGTEIVSPSIAAVSITPDGWVLAVPKGYVSPVAIGMHQELIRDWFSLLAASKLTTGERMEAESLFAAKIGYQFEHNA